MKTHYLILLLSLFVFFACKNSEDHSLSAVAKAKKEKYLQLVEKYEIEGYEVPESEELWIELDLKELEAVYKDLHESKIAMEEREKKFVEVHGQVESAGNSGEKIREMSREHPEFFIPGE